ncbi:hypothetical protein HKX48_003625 [Thoreauomyces humboldtii]|nr:hypothetical protein HKX48_003625 [Thoreauomyces humboldtii]
MATTESQPPVVQSRRPRPAATTKCAQCSVTLEFSIPATSLPSRPGSPSATNGPADPLYPWDHYRVQCFSCLEVTTVPFSKANKKDTASAVGDGAKKSGDSEDAKAKEEKARKHRQQKEEHQQQSRDRQNKAQKERSVGGRRGTDESPLDLTFYELLDVAATATAPQIKKAYYLKAMKCHPDKNPDDPTAEEKFKDISQAYQVLSDPQRRSHYNQHGPAVNGTEAPFIDPEDFFKQQFGGDKFLDIIGEISIAKDFAEAMSGAASEGASANKELTAEERGDIRNRRVQKLVDILTHKLALFVESLPAEPLQHPSATDESGLLTPLEHERIATDALEAFRAVMALEAETLKTESYGVELLHAVGYTYQLKASYWLGKMDAEDGPVLKRAWGFGSRFAGAFREKAHIIGETVGTLRTAMDLQSSFSKLQELEKKKEDKKNGTVDAAAAAAAALADGSASPPVPGEPVGPVKTEEELAAEENELRTKLEHEAATKGLEALWRGCKLEVEGVLREVCDRVLGDYYTEPLPQSSPDTPFPTPKPTRRRRAEALRVLGDVYAAVLPDPDAAAAAAAASGAPGAER